MHQKTDVSKQYFEFNSTLNDTIEQIWVGFVQLGLSSLWFNLHDRAVPEHDL